MHVVGSGARGAWMWIWGAGGAVAHAWPGNWAKNVSRGGLGWGRSGCHWGLGREGAYGGDMARWEA